MIVAAMTLAIVVVAGGLYLLSQLSQRESYFQARNFRALNEVANQLEANLMHPFGVLEANCVRQERLKTTAFYRDAKFNNQECPSGSARTERTSNTVEDGDNTGGDSGEQDNGGSGGRNDASPEQEQEGKKQISVVERRALRWFKQTGDVESSVTVDFDSLVDPVLALRHFQSIAISRGDGTVLYQSGGRGRVDATRRATSDFLRFFSLNLEPREAGADRQAVPGLQEKARESNPLMRFAGSSVVPVTVGATEYLVFAIPFWPPVIPQAGDADDRKGPARAEAGWEKWIITGVVDARTFKRAHWEVQWGYAALFLVLLLLGLFSWPFIKLRFRGSAETFRVGSLYFLLLSGLLGGILLVEGVAVTHLYFSTGNQFDKAAEQLAKNIRNRLENEIRTAIQVHELESAEEPDSVLSAFIDPDGFAKTVADFFDSTQQDGAGGAESSRNRSDPSSPSRIEYSPATTFGLPQSRRRSLVPMSTFFLDGRGRLCGNFLATHVEQDIPAGLDLSKRAYYREIVHSGKWRPEPKAAGSESHGAGFRDPLLWDVPFVDSIRSITTNELESVVSFPAAGSRNCVVDFNETEDKPVYSREDATVFAMLLYFSTVEKVVLPQGFRFAVINRQSGKVLYHSDDDRRDRENFYVAAEDRGDLYARMRAGLAGPVSFFYDSTNSTGYVVPLNGPVEPQVEAFSPSDKTKDNRMTEVPLSVVVFYDEGLIELFAIQTGAMAFALLAVFALWIALLALFWQGLARILKVQPWAFIWPRVLPRRLLATLVAFLILVIFAVYANVSDHSWKWVFALGLMPVFMFAWLFAWARHESKRRRHERNDPHRQDSDGPWESVNKWFGASPVRRYWTRSSLLLTSFILVPGILVLSDLRDYQAYRYLYQANSAFDSAMTDRTRALFSMTDSLCSKGGAGSGICSRKNQQSLGAVRTSQRNELVERVDRNGVYGQELVDPVGDCGRWKRGLWQAQARHFPTLEHLDRLIRVKTSRPDGDLECSQNNESPPSTGTLYSGASVAPSQYSTLSGLALLALFVVGYCTKVVGSRLFGLDIVGAPQDLRPVPLRPEAERHMLVRVPDRIEGGEASRQDSIDNIIRTILTTHGIERPKGDPGSILDLSRPTETLQRWREHRTGWLTNGYCRIIGFQPSLEDAERRLLLLEIFEDLCRNKELVLILEVPVSPLFKLIQPGAYPRREVDADTQPSADEVHRWSLVFADFQKYYGCPPKLEPPVIGETDDVNKTVKRECEALFGLEKIRNAIANSGDDWLSKLNVDHTEQEKRMIVVRAIKDHARGEYRHLWDECTITERVLLYSMATGDCAHPGHPATEHLMRRGLIRFDPALRIANESFALFIRGAEDPRRLKEWRRQISSNAWFYVRVPLLVTLGIIGFFVFSYFGDVANMVAAGIPSSIAALTVITRLFARRNLGA